MRKILMLLFLVVFGITLVSCGDDELSNDNNQTAPKLEKSHSERQIYYDEDGNITSDGKTDFLYKYDLNGNLIEYITKRYNGEGEVQTQFVVTYEYNDKNQMIKCHDKSINIEGKVYAEDIDEFEYDLKGNQIVHKNTTINNGYVITSVVKSTYDENNNLIESIAKRIYSETEIKITSKTTYTYEYINAKQIIKMICNYSSASSEILYEQTTVTEYKYDSNGNLCEEKEYDLDSAEDYYLIKYLNGKEVESCVYEDNELEDKAVFEYDSFGNMISSKLYLYYEGIEELSSITTCEYNEEGYLTREVYQSYSKDNFVNKIETIYTYFE